MTAVSGDGMALTADVLGALMMMATLLTPAGSVVHRVNFPSCRHEPPQSPSSVECDLGGNDSIVISAEDLPASVRRLRIVNAARVLVNRNALQVLNTPENIHFENITVLRVKRNSPVATVGRMKVTITLNRIDFVRLASGSFSHWGDKPMDISIIDIGNTCQISDGALVSRSSATNVTLENIADGQFYTGTFATTLGGLTMKNITMLSPCRRRTFGGRISVLSLTSVRIGNVQEGCFHAVPAWDSLEIRSSHLGNISEDALQGKITDVRIEDSQFGHIGQRGFHLQVSSFSVGASLIEVLEGDALDVQAKGVISIQKSEIISASENAFGSLRSTGTGQRIKLFRLTIHNVVDGSLRFSDVRSLALHELQIRSSCKCDIWEQILQLFFGGNPPSALTKRETNGLLGYAQENILCLHSNATPSLLEYHLSECSPQLDTICNGTDEAVSTAATPLWIPLGASLGGFLFGITIALLVTRQCRHQRRSHGQKLIADDEQIPLRDLTRLSTTMDIQEPRRKEVCSGPQTGNGDSMAQVFACATVTEAAGSSSARGNAPCERTYENLTGVSAYRNIQGEKTNEDALKAARCENKLCVRSGEENIYEEISRFPA